MKMMCFELKTDFIIKPCLKAIFAFIFCVLVHTTCLCDVHLHMNQASTLNIQLMSQDR